MQRVFKITSIVLLWSALGWLPVSRADEIVMNSGERFTTDQIWIEGDKIRFSMQGLLVSVEKSEVAEVIRAGGEATPFHAPAPTPSPHPIPELTPRPPETVAPPPPGPTRTPLLPWSRDDGEGSSSDRTTASAGLQGTGLQGIAWGMAPGELPGLDKIKTEPLYGGVDLYWRPEQKLQLGAAPLDGWVYNFWQDQLYSIIMWVDGRIGYERMKREVLGRYGQGVQRRPEVERFVWDDAESQRMLEFDGKSRSGIFVMRSSRIDARIKEHYPFDPAAGASPNASPKTSN